MGAFISLSQAAVKRDQSSCASFPVRSRCDSTLPSLHIRRCVTSAFDISSVNSATGTPWRTAMFTAAQGPHLVDDPRVVRCVRGRRNERRQLVDPRPSADVLELASLLELVDERDRVDGLALRIERECRPVDLRVALAIEIAGVQHFADRPDCSGGEHHCPENRLLGLEVLGRNRGGRRMGLGDLDDHYAGVETSCGATATGVHKWTGPTRTITS